MGEMLIGEPMKCGIGQGEKCCVFLVSSPNGFECVRDTLMGKACFFRNNMKAKRAPIQPFPECQLK